MSAPMPARRPAPAAVVAVALLATGALGGCAELLGGCDPTDTARWIQPGLYRAIIDSGAAVTRTDAPEGLPFVTDIGNATRVNASLADVTWRPENGSRGGPEFREAALRAADEPVVILSLPAEASVEDARELFRAFVANVSAAPASDRQRWEDALIASRNVSGYMQGDDGATIPLQYSYEVRVSGPFTIERLLEDLGGAAAGEQGMTAPGLYHLHHGEWNFYFRIAYLEHQAEVDGSHVRLSVDALDHADVGVSHGAQRDAERSIRAVNALLAQLGAPPSSLRASDLSTVVC